MIYQIKITVKDPDKADAVFEAIQNGGNFYDNCIIEQSTPPVKLPKNCLGNVVTVEGHDEEEVKALYETYINGYKGARFQWLWEEEVLNKENISSITMESLPDEDTILNNRREETGFLMVRTAGYYEDLLRKILSVKEILPALMSLDNYLDTLIAEALKK